MILARGADTVEVTKVKGHATEADVDQGRVREEDKLGNAEADSAADLGRQHQPESVMDVRRILLQVRTHWNPIIQRLHRFMIVVSRVSVNHDGRGGIAPDSLVWDQRGRSKQRRVDIRVNIDLATLPEPPGLLQGPWVPVRGGSISYADIAAWPCSVSLLCKFVSYWCTLHWPSGAEELGHFGVSYLEVMILVEQWAGHQLLIEKGYSASGSRTPPYFHFFCSCIRRNVSL